MARSVSLLPLSVISNGPGYVFPDADGGFESVLLTMLRDGLGSMAAAAGGLCMMRVVLPLTRMSSAASSSRSSWCSTLARRCRSARLPILALAPGLTTPKLLHGRRRCAMIRGAMAPTRGVMSRRPESRRLMSQSVQRHYLFLLASSQVDDLAQHSNSEISVLVIIAMPLLCWSSFLSCIPFTAFLQCL